MTFRSVFCLAVLSTIMFVGSSAQGQETPTGSMGQNVAEMKFTPVPGVPPCALNSVQSGDPTKGASIIFAKLTAGCAIPWHWHTPNEHLMMVTGTARIEMKDGKPLTLEPGGFAMLPSRHVHQFRCEQACTFYIYSDSAFDIHYVDAKGNEISPEEALKAIKSGN